MMILRPTAVVIVGARYMQLALIIESNAAATEFRPKLSELSFIINVIAVWILSGVC